MGLVLCLEKEKAREKISKRVKEKNGGYYVLGGDGLSYKIGTCVAVSLPVKISFPIRL
jgi:hypothetical protein